MIVRIAATAALLAAIPVAVAAPAAADSLSMSYRITYPATSMNLPGDDADVLRDKAADPGQAATITVTANKAATVTVKFRECGTCTPTVAGKASTGTPITIPAGAVSIQITVRSTTMSDKTGWIRL